MTSLALPSSAARAPVAMRPAQPRWRRLAVALGWASNPLGEIDRLCDTVVGLLRWRYWEEVAAWRIQLIDNCLEELSEQLRRSPLDMPETLVRLSVARAEFLAADTWATRASRFRQAGERVEDCCMQIWRRAQELDPLTTTRIRLRA